MPEGSGFGGDLQGAIQAMLMSPDPQTQAMGRQFAALFGTSAWFGGDRNSTSAPETEAPSQASAPEGLPGGYGLGIAQDVAAQTAQGLPSGRGLGIAQDVQAPSISAPTSQPAGLAPASFGGVMSRSQATQQSMPPGISEPSLFSDPAFNAAINAAPPGVNSLAADMAQRSVDAMLGSTPPSGLPSVNMNNVTPDAVGGSTGGGAGGVGPGGGHAGMGGTSDSTGHNDGDPDSSGGGVGGTGTGGGAFAKGTRAAPAGWAWVGERGPELVRMVGGEKVVPAHKSPAMAKAVGMGGPGKGKGFALGTDDAAEAEDIPFPRNPNAPRIYIGAQPETRVADASADPWAAFPVAQSAPPAPAADPWAAFPKAQAGPGAAPAMPGTQPPRTVGEALQRAPERAQQPMTVGTGLPTVDEILAKHREVIEGERDPRVDYESGTSYDDAVAMNQASNPAETRKYLENKYGRERVFQDKGANFYVQTPDGKLVQPGTQGVLKNVGAYLQAEAPTMVGAGVGASKGAALGAGVTGPLAPIGAPVGGILGAMIGGMAGRQTTEAYKGARGRQEAPLGGFLESQQAGIESGVGEGAGRMITGLPRTAWDVWRKKMAGVTPETTAMTNLSARYGGVPPAASTVPNSKATQWHERLYTGVFGDRPVDARSIAAMDRHVREIFRNFGIPDDQIDDVALEVFRPQQLSSLPVDQALRTRTQAIVAQLDTDVRQIAAEAEKATNQQFSRIDAIKRANPAGNLGEDIGVPIAAARKDLSRSAERIYERVERATLDPVTGLPARGVPSDIPQRLAREALEQMGPQIQAEPALANSTVVRQLTRIMQMEPMMTIGEAQYARSFLRNLADDPTLTPGLPTKQLRDAAESFDIAMKQAARENPQFKQAKALLDAADAFYSNGIRKFEDTTINDLVQQSRSGLPVDADKVASMVLKPGNQARTLELKRMVGPEMWQRVASADWDAMVKPTINEFTKKIDARALAAEIHKKDLGGLLEITYGPKIAGEMRSWVEKAGARAGEIDPVDLRQPGAFRAAMQKLVAKQREADAFMKENFLSALAQPQMREQAVQYLVQPRQEARLLEVVKTYGAQSPEMDLIRQQFLKEAIHASRWDVPSGAGATVSGNKLMQFLGQYTKAQLDTLMPGGRADDVLEVARHADFLFPGKGRDMAANLAAGEMKADIPGGLMGRAAGKALSAVGYTWLSGKIITSPWFANAVANGLREGGPAAKITAETVRVLARQAAMASGDDLTPASSSERVRPEALP